MYHANFDAVYFRGVSMSEILKPARRRAVQPSGESKLLAKENTSMYTAGCPRHFAFA